LGFDRSPEAEIMAAGGTNRTEVLALEIPLPKGICRRAPQAYGQNRVWILHS